MVNMRMGEHLSTTQETKRWFSERRYSGQIESNETKCFESVSAELCKKDVLPIHAKTMGRTSKRDRRKCCGGGFRSIPIQVKGILLFNIKLYRKMDSIHFSKISIFIQTAK